MKRMAVFVFSLLFLVSCVNDLDKKPRPTISHMLVKNPYLDVKWSKNDIDVSVDENMAMLVVASSRVVALGQNIYTQTIYAFDSITGTQVWKQDGARADIIAAHDSVFYTTNLNVIYAYNIVNGDILWNNRLPYDGRLAFLTFYKDKIFTFSKNDTFVTLDSRGNILESKGPLVYPTPELVEDNITYAHKNGIIAMDTKTGNILWESHIAGGYTQSLFLDDAIYVRQGDSIQPGNVYAINKSNGDILWKNDETTISNVCALA